MTCPTTHSKHMAEQGQTHLVQPSAWALETTTQWIIYNCPQRTCSRCLLGAQGKLEEGVAEQSNYDPTLQIGRQDQQGKASCLRLHRE